MLRIHQAVGLDQTLYIFRRRKKHGCLNLSLFLHLQKSKSASAGNADRLCLVLYCYQRAGSFNFK